MADLKALAETALAVIISRQTSSVVSVVAGANTVDAIRETRANEADLGDSGEMGVATSVVHCNADDIGTLTRGQTITVDGVSVFVLVARTDPAGAIMTVEYSEQRPLT